MKIMHNKLIRDKIPEIINKDHKKAKIHKLDNDQYIIELKKKLIEESNEVSHAKSKDETIKEIADVLEVIDALKICLKINEGELLKIKDTKAQRNGKFEKRLFLEYVEAQDE